MLALKDYRQKVKGLPDLLVYAGLIDNGIILNKDASFTAGWICRGKDTDSADPIELMTQAAQFNNAAKLLGTGWMMHMDAFRGTQHAYSPKEASFFPTKTGQLIEDERREYFKSDHCYTTTNALTLTYKPNFQATRLAGKAQNNADTSSVLEKALTRFKHTIIEMDELLSSVFDLERLGEYQAYDPLGNEYKQSDLLSHINQCITGQLQPVRVPDVPMYLDSILGMEDLIGGIEPRIGNKWLAVLSLDGLPAESKPCMLHVLNKLPISFRWSTRAIMLDQYDAEKEVEVYWKTWNQQVFRFMDKFFNNPNARPNKDALTMRDDSEQAKLEIQNGVVGGCYLTSSIILTDENKETLFENARELRKTIRTLGFGCRIETINALEAWMGTHPGNSFANVRRPMVHTLNLAHVAPLSTVWTGQPVNPCPFYPPNSPPLSVVMTDGATPFWFNLHVGDVGHTLVFGPTGSGKSTLIAHLVNQFFRYKNAQVFAFDFGNSLLPLCYGVGGTHYELGGEEGAIGFAPLADLDSETDRAWAGEWIASLMELQGVIPTPSQTNSIREGLNRLAGNPHNMRGLSEFYNVVPDVSVKEAIKHYTVHGGMGHMLDAKFDTVGLTNFTVFEIEQLMSMGDKNLIPVLTYLFRKIEKNLTGAPTILVIDEGWVVLGHSVFRQKLREWLKTLRKKNCIVLFATQSLSDSKQSGILDVLVESCPTKILLPNDTARSEEQAPLYTDIGCNKRMIDIIATSTPKREYYIIQPGGKRLINLVLGKKELAFVGASDKENLAIIKQLYDEYGADDWQEHWLKYRNAI